MKLVVVKKCAKKWTSAKAEETGRCCILIEGTFWPCFEIGLNG